MSLLNLSQTISKNVCCKQPLTSCSHMLHKFLQNYPYHIYPDVYNVFKTKDVKFVKKQYKVFPVFKDNVLKTDLIEWKPHAKYSFEDDPTIQAGIMVLLNGEMKEKVYHHEHLYFRYECLLHPNKAYTIDSFSYQNLLLNITCNNMLTFHVSRVNNTVKNFS